MASAAAFGPPALHIRTILSSSTSPGVSPSPISATGQARASVRIPKSSHSASCRDAQTPAAARRCSDVRRA
eukprot:5728540-Prymnesium_polylepis.1